MPTIDEMKSALTDVRRAYRLLWSYQRRVLDMVSVIADGFPEHEFYVWQVYPRDPPAKQKTDPSRNNKWAWDLLPLQTASFLYLPTEANPSSPQVGQWMLEIRVESDSGFEERDDKREPDAADFEDAAQSSSSLYMCAWLCTGPFQGNWLHDVWRPSDHPDEDCEAIGVDALPFKAVGKTFDLAELGDEDMVGRAVAEFRDLISLQLRLGDE